MPVRSAVRVAFLILVASGLAFATAALRTPAPTALQAGDFVFHRSRSAPEVEPSARRESGSRWASTEITRLKLGLHERLDTNIPVCHGFRQEVRYLIPGQRSRFRSSYT